MRRAVAAVTVAAVVSGCGGGMTQPPTHTVVVERERPCGQAEPGCRPYVVREKHERLPGTCADTSDERRVSCTDNPAEYAHGGHPGLWIALGTVVVFAALFVVGNITRR